MIVEADGGPLGVVVAGANIHDTKLLKQTIEAIVVDRPEPTDDTPQHLCLDRAMTIPRDARRQRKHTMSRTFGGSARKNWMRRIASGVPPAGGSWSGHWAG